MKTTLLGSAVVLGLAVFGITIAAQGPASDTSKYAWADSCRKCHEPVYDAWAKTKHATALDRLSATEQEQDCIGCHVTGPKERVYDGKKVLNKGVQCEACHGGAAAHAADPAVKAGLAKKPGTELCEQCHSAKSPKFKGFWYDAMRGFVHKIG
jgi:hypothetical protein